MGPVVDSGALEPLGDMHLYRHRVSQSVILNMSDAILLSSLFQFFVDIDIIWYIYGIYMVYICGVYIVSLWYLYGIYMVYVDPY